MISNLENFYSDDYFDTKFAIYIYKFTTDSLESINDQLYKKFEDLKKKCEQYTDCVRNRNWGDYCWNDKILFKNWHYRSVPHTNNHIKLVSSFNNIENFIEKESIKIINDFTIVFSDYLNSYTNEVQILFDNLYNYSEKKLNSNENLNELINQYLQILDNMAEIAENEIEFEGKNIEFYIENIFNKTINVEADFFENYYLKYPDEIFYKISNLENELKSSSEIVKQQINYIVNKRIWRIGEENYNFILKTRNTFNKIIELKMDKIKIFNYYKEYRLKNNLGKIFSRIISSNNNIKDFLTENVYENNIKKIINEYKIIVSKIEERINKDWIIKNCTEIDITDDTNGTNIFCDEYKNKSSLNYSEYNFNVVKIRTGIYYIKYLYENLEILFNQFDFNNLMNLSLILQKDEIINDKNILDLYQKSKEKTSEINMESEDLLSEYFYYYEEDINNTIKNELDFTKNFEKFEKILKFSEENFVFEVNKKINKSTFEIFEMLDEYNDTLKAQVELAKKYEKYNFNSKAFKDETDKNLKEIEKSFENLINTIKNNKEDFMLNNALKVKIESLNAEKAKYFKNLIIDLSKNYDIKPFNLTFDVGERTETFINNVFDNLMFSHIYEYIELYENNRDIFIKFIIEKINVKREKIIFKYKEITNDFYDELKQYSTEYINKDYLKEYEKKL